MTARLEGRNGDIWKKYSAGATQEALADEYGIGQQRVSQIIREVRAALPESDLDEERTKHLDAVRLMSARAHEIAFAPPPPLYSNGRPVLTEDGQYVLDYSHQLAAMDRVVKMQERLAKVLGLDAAAKVDVSVTEAETEAVRAAAVEATARLLGDD